MASTTTAQNASQRKRPSKRKKPRRVVARIPVLHTYYKLETGVKFKDDTCGECESSSDVKVIRISETQDEVHNFATTFWHEFGHAMFNELGYKDDFESEAKVEGFAHAMMVLFVDPDGRKILKNMLARLPEKR